MLLKEANIILPIRKTWIGLLILCFMNAAFVCVSQVNGNRIVIAIAMLFFFIFSVSSAIKEFAIPVLFFFLPWSTILKLAPGEISFYTLALIIICMVYFIKSQFKFDAKSICLMLLIFAITLISKIIDEKPIAFNYLMFIYLMIFFPSVMQELYNTVNYKIITIFFSAGIITAALSAQELVTYPMIARYIDVYSWNVVTRLSGYYGDPNFYSAHITAALSGVLLLILSENNVGEIILLSLLSIVLLYCGFISASKSFVITMVLIFSFWCVAFLIKKKRIILKIGSISIFVFTLFFVFSSNIFSELLDVIIFRFGQSSDVTGLTTGRTDLWKDYLNEIFTNPKIFFLGKGITDVKLHEHGSHNTLIQTIYQLGIIGGSLWGIWVANWMKSILKNIKISIKFETIIMGIGIFLPWFAIDLLFFDEIFLMPVYFGAGIIYFWQRDRLFHGVKKKID